MVASRTILIAVAAVCASAVVALPSDWDSFGLEVRANEKKDPWVTKQQKKQIKKKAKNGGRRLLNKGRKLKNTGSNLKQEAKAGFRAGIDKGLNGGSGTRTTLPGGSRTTIPSNRPSVASGAPPATTPTPLPGAGAPAPGGAPPAPTPAPAPGGAAPPPTDAPPAPAPGAPAGVDGAAPGGAPEAFDAPPVARFFDDLYKRDYGRNAVYARELMDELADLYTRDYEDLAERDAEFDELD